MASLQNRIIGAMTLQASTFEEVESDPTSMSQAIIVVVGAAVSSGVAWVWYNGFTGIVTSAIGALIGWAVGAVIVWLVGTKMLPGPKTQADIPQVLRTVGFAQSPGLLAFIAIIPLLGWLIAPVIWIWTLVAWVIAVKQVLDYDDYGRAILVCVIAIVIQIVVAMMFAAMSLGAAFMTRPSS
jgi:hypothetical protein